VHGTDHAAVFSVALRGQTRAVRRVATAVLVVLCLAGCKGGTMTPFRLERDAESLQSIAADAAITANSAAQGDTTDAFVRAHVGELEKDAGRLADVVASTRPEPQLRRETRRLEALSRRLATLLARLERDPGDRALARRVRAVCSDVARRAERLGQSA
jgi:hypothetical protein